MTIDSLPPPSTKTSIPSTCSDGVILLRLQRLPLSPELGSALLEGQAIDRAIGSARKPQARRDDIRKEGVRPFASDFDRTLPGALRHEAIAVDEHREGELGRQHIAPDILVARRSIRRQADSFPHEGNLRVHQ